VFKVAPLWYKLVTYSLSSLSLCVFNVFPKFAFIVGLKPITHDGMVIAFRNMARFYLSGVLHETKST